MYKTIFNCIFSFILSLHTNVLLASQETPLHIPIYNIGTSLDPGKKESSYSTWVSRQINCQLIRATESYPILEAADSMRYINPWEVSVKLKPDLTFNNNQLVTAYDVKEKALQYHHIENVIRDECVAVPIVTVPMETFFIKGSLNALDIGKSILEEYYLGNIN